MEKTCTKCGKEKSIDDFGKDRKAKDGLFYWCKECSRKHRRGYYKANREVEKAKALVRHHESQKDPKYRERRKKYQKDYNQEYMRRPKTKRLCADATKRYVSSPGNRISRRMGFQVWTSLRNTLDKSKRKNGRHWENIVGFTIDELMFHLESLFVDGMSWDNYGGKDGWQIDHVTSRSWFDIHSSDDEAFRRCWSLDNLQPLWLRDNASKGARFAG